MGKRDGFSHAFSGTRFCQKTHDTMFLVFWNTFTRFLQWSTKYPHTCPHVVLRSKDAHYKLHVPSSNTHPKINICFVLLVLISNERLPPLPTTLGWLAGWLVGWQARWLAGWLAGLGWLSACLGWLAVWLAGWLVGWLD